MEMISYSVWKVATWLLIRCPIPGIYLRVEQWLSPWSLWPLAWIIFSLLWMRAVLLRACVCECVWAHWISRVISLMPAWYLPLHPAVKPTKALLSYNFSLASGLNASSSLFVSLSTVLLSVLQANGQTEMKRVVGDNATLPCHHQLWQADITLLDIEWMLHKSSSRQTVVSVCVCVCMRQCAADAAWPSLICSAVLFAAIMGRVVFL